MKDSRDKPGNNVQRDREDAGLLRALDDNLTATVVTALRADAMIHHGCTAVGAGAEGGNGREIVRSSLVPSLLGDFMFRMCHN
jgi:hypothetical protein